MTQSGIIALFNFLIGNDHNKKLNNLSYADLLESIY